MVCQCVSLVDTRLNVVVDLYGLRRSLVHRRRTTPLIQTLPRAGDWTLQFTAAPARYSINNSAHRLPTPIVVRWGVKE